MHEIHTAQKIVRMALSAVEASDHRRLKTIHVRVGAWTGIDVEHLKHDFQSVAPGVDLHIDLVEPEARCEDCGASFDGDMPTLECSKCGSRRIRMRQTKDIELVGVETS